MEKYEQTKPLLCDMRVEDSNSGLRYARATSTTAAIAAATAPAAVAACVLCG